MSRAASRLSYDGNASTLVTILFLNGIFAEHPELNEKTLLKVKMPNRDGFVADPRPDVALKPENADRLAIAGAIGKNQYEAGGHANSSSLAPYAGEGGQKGVTSDTPKLRKEPKPTPKPETKREAPRFSQLDFDERVPQPRCIPWLQLGTRH